MKTYEVKVPIAGHLIVLVQASTQEDAIIQAVESGTIDDLEDWEAIRQFHTGNICYCPRPWEAEVLSEDEEDEQPPTTEEGATDGEK